MLGPKEPVARVLVVDDAPEIRLMLLGILESEQFQVEMARDGAEARLAVECKPIDLIVLDLDLPDAFGSDLCREWRDAGYQIPILMLTSHNQENERVAGLECGADDYIGKPFHPEEFLARVKAQLRRQQAHEAQTRDLLRSQWQRIENGFRLTQRNQKVRAPGRLASSVKHIPMGRIGGDFYWLEELPNKTTAIVVADVMGKGLGASLVMSSVLSHCYELVHQYCSPSQLLNRLNAIIGPELSNQGTFVAMFCAVLFEEDGSLDYSSAGLEPPICLRPRARGRRHLRLNTEGLPIGIVLDFDYQEKHLRLDPGDQLFIFTDGLSESVPPEQQDSLMRRVYRILLNGNLSVQSKISHIMQCVQPDRLHLRDDITFVLVECPQPLGQS